MPTDEDGAGKPRTKRVGRIALDIRPLRSSRDFRLLWIGNSISMLGSAIASVALPFQVYVLTRSPFLVGMIGAAELVPLLVCSIVGGSIADASDRRKLMGVLLILQAGSSAVLAVTATPHVHLWLLFGMAAIQAGLWGLVIPTRRSWSSRLVDPNQLPAAAALEGSSMTFTHLAGPAIGGIAIASLGFFWTYWIDVLSFAFGIAAVVAMRPSPPSEHARAAGLRSILEGLRFLKGKKELQGIFWIDLNAMVFGLPKALFPAIAVTLGGPKVVGLLYAAPFLGAFIGTLTSGWTTRIRHQGRAVSIAVVVWGIAITSFGFMHTLWLSIAMLAVAGLADEFSAIFRTAIVQQVTPDHLRGRLSGMEIAVYAGGPTLGDVEAGVIAGLTSVRTSVVSGGLACIVGAGLVALAFPALNRYDRSKAAHAQTMQGAERGESATIDGTAP